MLCFIIMLSPFLVFFLGVYSRFQAKIQLIGSKEPRLGNCKSTGGCKGMNETHVVKTWYLNGISMWWAWLLAWDWFGLSS